MHKMSETVMMQCYTGSASNIRIIWRCR